MKYKIPKEFEKRPAVQGIDLSLIVSVGVNLFIALLLLMKANFKGFFVFLFIGLVIGVLKWKFKEKGSLEFFLTGFFKPKYITQNTKVEFLITKNVNHENQTNL